MWGIHRFITAGEEIARTRLFLVLVFFELVLAISCRSLKYNITKAKPHQLAGSYYPLGNCSNGDDY